jgi:hypothetical protein
MEAATSCLSCAGLGEICGDSASTVLTVLIGSLVGRLRVGSITIVAANGNADDELLAALTAG